MIPKSKWIKHPGFNENMDGIKQQQAYIVGKYIIEWSSQTSSEQPDREVIWIFNKSHDNCDAECKEEEFCFTNHIQNILERTNQCDGEQIFNATCLFYSCMDYENSHLRRAA